MANMTSVDDGYNQEYFKTNDGLQLAYRSYGSAFLPKVPAICLPGLTRNSADFHDLALHLSKTRRVISLDARGRGRSEYDSKWQNYNVVMEVGDIIALLNHCQISRAIFIGTSRGGIQSMIYSAVQSANVAGMVLNDIGPEVDTDGLDRIVDAIKEHPPALDWPTAANILKQGNESQFPEFTDAQWLDFAKRSYHETPEGICADHDPNLIKQVTQELEISKGANLWSQFASLKQTPLMAIRGALSDILSKETMNKMLREKPDMEAVTVRNIGHAPLLSEPEVLSAMDQFLLKIDYRESK